jgi:four helix bundle protein
MNDLKPRTKKFALDVILYSRNLPHGDEFTVIKRQLIRSATSTAANYRSAQRAKSKADFINKLAIAEEEADESLFWLEFLADLATNQSSGSATFVERSRSTHRNPGRAARKRSRESQRSD